MAAEMSLAPVALSFPLPRMPFDAPIDVPPTLAELRFPLSCLVYPFLI